ncbi:MAG: methyl-accepting chemotaxis protein, partial [Burkholderiaceae bacterium]|nr:methyl-accepting chemotaxis protein [Burkholderiaceae bacterium]
NDRVIALARANQDAEAVQVLLKEAAPATQRWQDAIDVYVERQKKNNAEDVAEAQAAYERARNWMLAISALALVVAVVIALRISRSLLRQLGGEPAVAADVASRIAAGDLTVQVDTHADDRHSMLFAMKTMRDALFKIVTEVRGGTEAIATASAQIASGNQDLSMRTEQQAGALEETASSMEELTSAVRQNNDHARHANQLAQSASAVAVQGGSVVSQVVDTMGDINASSRKIVDIIAVIDGIAFQTNILALNAAVEAARAGEQGRGFAVVASEVRTLAQRSASAAREIKELIGNSVEKVEQGSKLVEQAGATMDEVVASVRRVTDIMSEISGAGDEQSAGIEQINQAVSEMDTVTQQNAALVEEAAAAAAAMQQQAEQLERVVSVFQLGNHSAAHTSVAGQRRLATPATVTQLQPRRAAVPLRASVQTPARAALGQRSGAHAASAQRANATAAEDSWEEF